MTTEQKRGWSQWIGATATAAITGCFVLITYLHATFPTKDAIAQQDIRERQTILMVRDELKEDIKSNRLTLHRLWDAVRELRSEILQSSKDQNKRR